MSSSALPELDLARIRQSGEDRVPASTWRAAGHARQGRIDTHD